MCLKLFKKKNKNLPSISFLYFRGLISFLKIILSLLFFVLPNVNAFIEYVTIVYRFKIKNLP